MFRPSSFGTVFQPSSLGTVFRPSSLGTVFRLSSLGTVFPLMPCRNSILYVILPPPLNYPPNASTFPKIRVFSATLKIKQICLRQESCSKYIRLLQPCMKYITFWQPKTFVFSAIIKVRQICSLVCARKTLRSPLTQAETFQHPFRRVCRQAAQMAGRVDAWDQAPQKKAVEGVER